MTAAWVPEGDRIGCASDEDLDMRMEVMASALDKLVRGAKPGDLSGPVMALVIAANDVVTGWVGEQDPDLADDVDMEANREFEALFGPVLDALDAAGVDYNNRD